MTSNYHRHDPAGEQLRSTLRGAVAITITLGVFLLTAAAFWHTPWRLEGWFGWAQTLIATLLPTYLVGIFSLAWRSAQNGEGSSVRFIPGGRCLDIFQALTWPEEAAIIPALQADIQLLSQQSPQLAQEMERFLSTGLGKDDFSHRDLHYIEKLLDQHGLEGELAKLWSEEAEEERLDKAMEMLSECFLEAGAGEVEHTANGLRVHVGSSDAS